MQTISLRKISIVIIAMLTTLFSLQSNFALAQQSITSTKILVPKIDGEWWGIAGNPNLGNQTTTKQQPVDFGVWQAADGTWQLWSCIRLTKSGEKTRLFHRWEVKNLTDKNWQPKGIAMEADTTLGETSGGLQAPYVFKENDTYYMFYGDWQRICLAKSSDGKKFTRVLNANGQPDLFGEYPKKGELGISRARDAMVIKQENTYYCYYTNHIEVPIDNEAHADVPVNIGVSAKVPVNNRISAKIPVNDGVALCRTSLNMKDWSKSVIISHTPPFEGNSARYSDECPFVVYLPENNLYYLFVTQVYGKDSQTTVYASPNPMYFGVDDDSKKVCTLPIAAPEILLHNGQYYLVALNNTLDGIRMVKLKWE